MTELQEEINFAGRVVIVTGGGNGLGRAHCLALARHGATVVVNDLGANSMGAGHGRTAADRVAEEIRDMGGTAMANYDSVATREGGAAIVASTLDKFGRIDALVNNAGFITDAAFEEQSDQQIDAMLAVHLKGAFYVTQPAFRAMKRAGYGRIVFTGSSSAMFGHAWQTSYGAAKAGIMGLMNVVALEGEDHGILANLVMPTAVTRLMDAMSDGFLENKAFVATMARADLQAMLPTMQPAFAAPLVVYLASNACQSTHNLYSQAGNRYARVFIGVTRGWTAAGDMPPSPAAIASHWQEIEDRTVYDLPLTSYDEFALVSPAKTAS